MADLVLTKPESGSVTVQAAPDSTFVINFTDGGVTLAKDGQNLQYNFEDGTSITVEGFYDHFNKDNVPNFVLQGEQIPSQEYFAQNNASDIEPAAGPAATAAAAAAARNGRYNEYGGSDLMNGLEHLNGLDWGMNRGFEWEEGPYSVGRNSDDGYGNRLYSSIDSGNGNNPVTVVPSRPDTLPPDTPQIPQPGQPGQPDYIQGGNGINGARDVLQVAERGLVDGDPSKIVVDGSMDITAPDGVGNITIGGITVWENGAPVPGVTVPTDEGTLSNIQFDPTTGKLTYTYTLDKNTLEHQQPGDDNIAHNIPVTVTDVDGDSDTSFITVVITDDVPEATDDTASIVSGTKEPITGNVLVNDTFGADGPSSEDSVVLISDPKGEYGTITLNPDGTYSFVLDNDNPDVKDLKPGQTLTQEFEYTITDADGDTSTATITITIDGGDNPVDVTPENPSPVPPDTPIIPDPSDPDNPDKPSDPDDPNNPDPDNPDGPFDPENPDNPGVGVGRDVLQVYEKGLVDGDSSKTVAHGVMDVNAPDGVGTITIAGVTVWENGQLVDHPVISTDEGHLENISFDPATGKLSYDFVLDRPTSEHNQSGSDNIGHNLKVTVTDVDGDTDSSYITVIIRDDVPEAKNDVNSIKEGATEPITGNVLVNDNFGADGKAENNSVVLDSEPKGEYGTITLNPDGSYSFVLDNDNPDVKALLPGETLTQEFKYTITDADGDTSQATLTITINGVNNPVDVTPENPTPVPPDTPIIPDPDNPDPDDPDNPEEPDNPDPDNPDNPDNPGVGVGRDVLQVYESGLAADGKGQTVAHGVMDVDAPDGVGTITIAGVTVWENGKLVDNPQISTDEGHLENIRFDPATGKLSYDFVLDRPTTEHGKPGADTIGHNLKVTVTDVDGDTDHSYITVVVHDDVPQAGDDFASINEGESWVSGSLFDNDRFGADGKAEGGDHLQLLGNAEGKYGTITLNPDGTYKFELNNNNEEVKNLDKGETLTQTFKYQITDKDGDTSEATLTITINGVGDPTIVPGNPTDPDPDPNPEDPVAPGSPVSSVVTDESYMTDGTHTAPEGGDNAASSASAVGAFQLTLNGRPYTLTLSGADGEVVTVNLDAAGNLVDANALKGVVLEGKFGDISNISIKGGKVLYTYTQKEVFDHDNTNSHDEAANAEKFGITVSDGLHNPVSSFIQVVIEDDGPVFESMASNEQVSDAASTITANLNGIDFGADHNGATATVEVNGTPYEFTVTQNAKGDYTFTAKDADAPVSISGANGKYVLTYTRPAGDIEVENTTGAADEYVFNVTITDSDGDKASQSVTVNTVGTPHITPDPDPDPDPEPNPEDPVEGPKVPVSTVVTDESYIAGGADTNPADDHDASSATAVGAFQLTLNGQPYTLTLTGANNATLTLELDASGNLVKASGETLQGQYGTISNISVNGGKVYYTYTQTGAFNHTPDKGFDQSANAETFDIKVNDGIHGDVSSFIQVMIEDDGPVIGNVQAAGNADLSLNGTFNLNFGADNAASSGALIAEIGGVKTELTLQDGSYSGTVDGGILTLTGTGNAWTYVYTPVDNADLTFNKTITINATDIDGDTTSANITVIQNKAPGITPEDPNNPGSFKPGVNGNQIVVDEGKNPESHDKNVPHSDEGNGAFLVNLHGEDGTITLKADGNTDVVITVKDGLASLAGSTITVQGVQVTFDNPTMSNGQWLVTYKYKLDGNQQHVDGETPTAVLGGTIDIIVQDTTMKSEPATSQITVEVHDDLPSLTLSNTNLGHVVSGNTTTTKGKLSFDFGADDDTGKHLLVNGKPIDMEDGHGTIETEKGFLNINNKGEYTYTAKPNVEGTDTFTFEIKDSDGDIVGGATAGGAYQVTITVDKPTTPVIEPVRVKEDGLVDANDNSNMHEVVAPAGDYTITAGGTGTYGHIEKIGDKWTYVLDKAMDSGDIQGDNEVVNADSVQITVQDGKGNTFKLTVNVNIVDDVPTIAATSPVYESDHVYTLQGNVSFNFNADNWDKTETQDSDKSLDLTLTRGETIFNAEGVKNGDSWVFELKDADENPGGVLVLQPDASGNYEYIYSTNIIDETTGRHEPLNPSAVDDLAYNFNFTITDADGDTSSADVNCVIRPTNIAIVPDPETTPGNEETPGIEYVPGVTPDTVDDVDNIILGSSTETFQPDTVYNMVFMFDTSGSCSVSNTGINVGNGKGDVNGATNLGYTIDKTVAAQDGIWNAYTKDTDGDGTADKYYFRGNDGNLFDYTELHNSMEQTIEYIKDAYNEIQPGSSMNVLLGGFDIKIESSAHFEISCDANGVKHLSVTQHSSQTPSINKDGTLGKPEQSQDGNLNSYYDLSKPNKYEGGESVETWLDKIFEDFNESVIYNLNSAFSQSASGFTYTASNIDNALGYTTGWLNQQLDKINASHPDDTNVVNKTFLLTDGGATAHSEKVTGALDFYHRWNGGGSNKDPMYKDTFDLTQVKKVWVGGENGKWVDASSWSDVDWHPGEYAIVQVAAGANSSSTHTVVINHLGLVTAPVYKGVAITGPNTPCSALKYNTGGSGVHGTGAYTDWQNSVPVVMDWDAETGTFVPSLSYGSLNNHGLDSNTNKIDVKDKDSQDEAIKTADKLQDISEITVIKFGEKEGDDLPDYATGGANGGNIIAVNDWEHLPDQIKSHMPKPVNDHVNGNKGDDILFGDSLTVAQVNAEGKYDSELSAQNNLAALAALVGLDKTDASAAEIAAELWQNSDKVAGKLDTLEMKGGNDTLIGGEDNDLLFGMNGNDVLFGDGDRSSLNTLAADMNSFDGIDGVAAKASTIVEKMADLSKDQLSELSDKLENHEGTGGSHGGHDKLYGGEGNDVLIGGEGNDKLIGGDGDDFLFGGSGDDYLDGGAGKDTIFGGSGNDIIVFDNSDYLIDGGSGIDFLVTDASNPNTLSSMLDNWSKGEKGEGPMVHDVEVMLSGKGVDTSLTSMKAMAEKYGFTLEKGEDGKDVLTLGDKWILGKEGADGETSTFVNATDNVTIETTLSIQQDASTQDEIVLAQQISDGNV